MPSTERSELRGTVLDGRYRLGACIGVGGTGVVFEAERLSDGEILVVKTMRPVYAENVDLARRLRREGEVARVVGHPGIVPVLDEGLLDDGSPYVVMPYIAGEGLNRLLLREETLTAAETCAIAMRVASVLHAVHVHGYVHRDIKPEHLLLNAGADGGLQLTVLDFGVCAAETAPTDERDRERGRVFGTPTYVSPEQASGNPDVDGRADVYGLGVVMFECLTGRVPFTAKTVTNLLRRIIREDPPRAALLSSEVSIEVDGVVTRAMARRPRDRFASPRALMRALVPHVGDRLAAERSLTARLRLGDQAVDQRRTVRRNAPVAA